MSSEVKEEVGLKETVEKFWDLDSVGIVDGETSVYDRFVDEIKFVNDRYEVKLPFKENIPMLEDNYSLCLKRLNNLRHRLEKDPALLKAYDDIIQEQLKKGIIEKVESPGELGETVYLPHRAVIKPEKNTKVRLVLDASCKNKGMSLNECLYKGPCLNPLLYDMLLRFRIHNIAMVADIEKSFLQISVAPEHRDYLRFLWYDDVHSKNPVVCKFRYNRVIFGSSPSLFLLNATVKTHVEQYRESDAEFVDKVLKHFYVDDFNGGVEHFKAGVELYKKVKFRFLEGNFNVQRWQTNDSRLRDYINQQESLTFRDDKNGKIQEKVAMNEIVDECIEGGAEASDDVSGNEKVEKVLGVIWRNDEDVLVVDLKIIGESGKNLELTKRNVLKILASFYDPVGFVQPVVVKMKLMFQELCDLNVDWDAPVNENFVLRWRALIEEINDINEIVIQRCYAINDISDPVFLRTLHGFSDASKKAYGCCIYLKSVTVSGRSKITLVTSKSRIAPSKKSKKNRKMTVPRLELLGNLLLCRLMTSVLSAFEGEMNIDTRFCWTDSQITLAWIKHLDKEYKTFVQNRLDEIRSKISPGEWFTVDQNIIQLTLSREMTTSWTICGGEDRSS